MDGDFSPNQGIESGRRDNANHTKGGNVTIGLDGTLGLGGIQAVGGGDMSALDDSAFNELNAHFNKPNI